MAASSWAIHHHTQQCSSRGEALAQSEPGTRQAYHGLTLGFYEGELMRRVDPRHRTLGQFFQDEIATPLAEDFYIRLPEEIPNARLATLSPPGIINMLIGFRPVRLLVEGLNPRSNISRALVVNPGTAVYLDESRVYARNLEVPAGGGTHSSQRSGLVRVNGWCETGSRRDPLTRLNARRPVLRWSSSANRARLV